MGDVSPIPLLGGRDREARSTWRSVQARATPSTTRADVLVLRGAKTKVRHVLNVPTIAAQVRCSTARYARVEQQADHAAERSSAMTRPSTEAAAKARTCRMASSSSPG